MLKLTVTACKLLLELTGCVLLGVCLKPLFLVQGVFFSCKPCVNDNFYYGLTVLFLIKRF